MSTYNKYLKHKGRIFESGPIKYRTHNRQPFPFNEGKGYVPVTDRRIRKFFKRVNWQNPKSVETLEAPRKNK